MFNAKKPLIFFIVLITGFSIVSAQDDCPAIVQQALQAAHQSCDSIGRNQACYGNINLQATPRDDVPDFTFTKPGDVADIGNVQALQLSSMDQTADSWGVALMKVQANLPDTLPGQNVTFVLFGDVQINNKGGASAPQPPTLNVTATSKVNVRSGPTSSDTRVASLSRGQTVTADGRNDGGDWIHVQLDGGQTGWVSASYLRIDGDVESLSVVEADAGNTIQYGPMQAFYFKSGVGDSPCDQAPSSGILVQSPQGVEHVTLDVNNVEIQLGSTVYLESCSCSGMDVSVVEGGATVTAFGVTRFVPAGTSVHIPTDNNGLASGPPEIITAYSAADVQALPINLLSDKITIAAPLTDAALAAAINPTPTDGLWRGLMTLSGGGQCYFANGQTTTTENNNTSFVFSDSRNTLTTTAHLDDGSTSKTVWKQGKSGVYTYNANQVAWQMTILSSTQFILEEHTSAGCYGLGTFMLVTS